MSNLNGRIILLADDERYITTTLSLKLRQAGATVMVANDGREAFTLASAQVPELIIADFQMPQLSGVELCERLKATTSTANVPAILLTTRDDSLMPTALARTNVRTILSKPFSARELLAKIDEVLNTPVEGTPDAAGEKPVTA